MKNVKMLKNQGMSKKTQDLAVSVNECFEDICNRNGRFLTLETEDALKVSKS